MNSLNPNSDFLQQATKEDYSLYNSLDSNKRKSLAATNYWRLTYSRP